jgi:hypothetical protein
MYTRPEVYQPQGFEPFQNLFAGPFRSDFPVIFFHTVQMCIECVPPQLVDITPLDHERFFRIVSGRRCNNLNHQYLMPADEDELRVRFFVRSFGAVGWRMDLLLIDDVIILTHAVPYAIAIAIPDPSWQRFELFHRMIRFVFGNKIYVGPVEKVLSPDRDTGGERLRVLDMGTGGGLWWVKIKPYTVFIFIIIIILGNWFGW